MRIGETLDIRDGPAFNLLCRGGGGQIIKPFSIHRDPATEESYLSTATSGRALLGDPMLNKGTAFTEEERRAFGLDGLLPPAVSTLDAQLDRLYSNFRTKSSDLERYAFL